MEGKGKERERESKRAKRKNGRSMENAGQGAGGGEGGESDVKSRIAENKKGEVARGEKQEGAREGQVLADALEGG